MHPQHLFVYGTLRQALGHPMLAWLRQHARFVGPGRVAGVLFDLGRYPGMLCRDGGGWVKGEIWRLLDADALLARLDAYEGCDAASPRPHEYRRIVASVWLRGAGRLPAWLYEYALDTTGLPRIADGDYPAHLARRRRLAAS